jgi:hypothetical protein
MVRHDATAQTGAVGKGIAMRQRMRFAVGLTAAACLLLAVAGSASANRLSLSNQSIRWTFLEYTSVNGGIRISCELTLEGSFHSRTFAKVRGALIGYINRASVRPGCRGEWGDMVFLSETLPWHVRYASFSGTLPRITSASVDIANWAWNYRGLSEVCLYRSTSERPARWILNRGESGAVTSIRADETIAVPFFSGGPFCARSINYSGTGSVSLTGTTNAITVTLI